MAEAGTGHAQEITSTLNDEGVASPTGKLWSKNGIHFILRNEALHGNSGLGCQGQGDEQGRSGAHR